MIISVFGFVGCCEENLNFGTGFQSYVSLSINPKVEFFVNEDGIVESVNASNQDAEIILSDYNLVGMNIKDATQIFVDAATVSGYVDLEANSIDPNNVEYSIISEQKGEELENTVKNTINNYFIENGIYGVSNKLFMDDLKASADELGISLGKYKLITRILELSTDYTIEELAGMEMKEVLTIFRIYSNQEQFGTLKDEFKNEVITLKEKYANMFSLRNQMETIEESINGIEEQIDLLEIDLQNTIDENAIIEIQNQINSARSEIEDLQNQLETLDAEYTVLHRQYMIEFEALKEEYKEYFSQLKDQLKLQKRELVNQNQSNVNQHKNGVGNAERNKIREWLNVGLD